MAGTPGGGICGMRGNTKENPAHGWHHGRAMRAELAGVFPLIIYIIAIKFRNCKRGWELAG